MWKLLKCCVRRASGLACGLGLLACASLAGCDLSSTDHEMDDDWAIELEFPMEPDEPNPAFPPRRLRDAGLVPGDTWTLRRRVDQHLEQPGEHEPRISRSTLQVDYCITYEGPGIPQETPWRSTRASTDAVISTAAATSPAPLPSAPVPQYRVRFLHVVHELDIPGRPGISFDSRLPVDEGGTPVVGCHGLADNGFRFWMSPQGELLAIDDFAAFLRRCSDAVADPVLRDEFRRALELEWGAEPPDQFLSDLIGLVPVAGRKPGDRWKLARQLPAPLAARSETEFVLQETRDEGLGLEWTTRILEVESPGADTGGPKIDLTGSETTGRARVDRRTGLPLEWRQTQTLKMAVRRRGTADLAQSKRTEIQIASLPEAPARIASPTADSAVTPQPLRISAPRRLRTP